MVGEPFGRRTLLRGAGALTAASLAPWAAGCTSDDENALTFFFSANPDEANARMRVVDEFQRQHPDIKVRPVLSGPGVMQQLSTFCAGGKCPDVLMSWELTYAELAARGVLLDLNTMLAQDNAFAAELKSDSIGPLYDTFAYEAGSKGGQYAFPEQWAGNFLFYNKKLFAEAGVPPPPTTWDKPWTFAEFLDTANALTQRDGSGRVDAVGIRQHLVVVLRGGLVRHEQRRAVVHAAEEPDPPQFRRPSVHRGACSSTPTWPTSTRRRPTRQRRSRCPPPTCSRRAKRRWRSAGIGDTRRSMRADGLDFDVTSLPIGPSLPDGHAAVSNIGATGLAIAASSRRKEQAWEFVKFAAGPVGQKIIGESCLFVPALRSALNSDGFAKAHHRIGNLAVLTTGPDHAEALPVTPAWEKVVALMDRNFGPVLRGSRPATSLAGLAHDVDEVLRLSMTSIDTSAATPRLWRGDAPGPVACSLRRTWPRSTVFMLFPLGFSLYMSFHQWDVFNPPKFVGLRNFRELFTSDPLFLIAIRNTAVFTVGTVVPTVLISLGRRRRAQPENKGHRHLSDHRLSATGHLVGGDGRRLAVRLQHRQRPAQHHARLDRDRPDPVAGRTPMGDVLAVHGQRVAQRAVRRPSSCWPRCKAFRRPSTKRPRSTARARSGSSSPSRCR